MACDHSTLVPRRTLSDLVGVPQWYEKVAGNPMASSDGAHRDGLTAWCIR